MKRLLFIIPLLGALLLAGTSRAVVTGSRQNPYGTIHELNGFRLRPPDPPPTVAPVAPPPSNVKLAGITTILSTKRVILQVVEQGKTTSLMLAEGEGQGAVEVMDGGIDEAEGRVKIKNGGIVTTLDFQKDGVKVVGGPTPVPGSPNPALSVPGTVPPPLASPTAALPISSGGSVVSSGGSSGSGGRGVVMSGANVATGVNSPGAPQVAVVQNTTTTMAPGGGGMASRSMPQRTLRLSPVTSDTIVQREKIVAEQNTVASNIIIMEQNRILNRGKNMPPIPNTELTRPEDSTSTTPAPAPGVPGAAVTDTPAAPGATPPAPQ